MKINEPVYEFPDYENSLVNLSCSMLQEFGVKHKHNTLACIDQYLAKKEYKNIVVFLLDGMGSYIINHHLDRNGFFRTHIKTNISSVFPPTTTAATTSIQTGLTPCEHGWLGWSLYFQEIDQIIDIFTNCDSYTGEEYLPYHVAKRYLPFESIQDQINRAGVGKSYEVSPFGTNHTKTFQETCAEVKRLCAMEGRKYIYAYDVDPDKMMHRQGSQAESVTKRLKMMEQEMEQLADSLEDTLLIITADHGHKDEKHYILNHYPDLIEMLIRPVTLEERAIVFYVKEEYKNVFPEKFNLHFPEGFTLYSKEEVIRMNLFGDGILHKKFEPMIGDFLAVATGDYGINYSDEMIQFKSHHAGLTKEEMTIPLIVVEK